MTTRNRDNYNAYMREYMKQRYYKRRAEIIERLGGICWICGSEERLEIDHIKWREKGFRINKRLASISQKQLDEEVKKCQLLCRDHHLQKNSLDISEIRREKRSCSTD